MGVCLNPCVFHVVEFQEALSSAWIRSRILSYTRGSISRANDVYNELDSEPRNACLSDLPMRI